MLFKPSKNPEKESINKDSIQTNNSLTKPNSSTLFTIIENPATKNLSQNKVSKPESVKCENHFLPHVMNDLTNKSCHGSDQYYLDTQTDESTLKTLSSQLLIPNASSNSEPLLLSSSPKFSKTRAYNSVPVIPETPESKPRKIIGRAFLASSAQLKNTVENKINQAKNVKLLKMKRKTKCAKPVIAHPIKEPTENSTLSNISVKECNLPQTESCSLSGSRTSVESVTPVKKYTHSHGNSLKRLAKNGISPSAKRNILADSCNFEKDVGENKFEQNEAATLENFQNSSADLSDNEIEMWENLSTKDTEVWDDLGLSLVDQEKEESLNEFHLNSFKKTISNVLDNQKTELDPPTNQKIAVSEEVAKQKTDAVNQLANQDELTNQKNENQSPVKALTNDRKTTNLFLKEGKEKKVKQQNYQMSWSFQRTVKKSKSKPNLVEDENLLLEILSEIPNPKTLKEKTDPEIVTMKKMPPNIPSLATSVDCVVPPSEINQIEDKNLLQEILCELNVGKSAEPEISAKPSVTGSRSKNSNHAKHTNAFPKSEFSQELKTNVNEYDCQDFSPWDSSFEIEETAADSHQLSVEKNVKHFDHSIDHVLSSTLEKLSPFKPQSKW